MSFSSIYQATSVILVHRWSLLWDGSFTLSTYDERSAALEKDAATMKRDIIYKLDDTNSAVTMMRGVIGNQGRDIRDIKSEVRDIKSDVRTVNVRLDGIDTRLEGMKEEIRAVKDQQDKQGQDITDIKRHLQEHTTVLQ